MGVKLTIVNTIFNFVGDNVKVNVLCVESVELVRQAIPQVRLREDGLASVALGDQPCCSWDAIFAGMRLIRLHFEGRFGRLLILFG